MESPTENPQGVGLGKKRILVAEAESPVVFSITNFLIGRGFEVHRTQAMEETIQTLRRAAVSFLPFHLLIIDENLPGEKMPLDAIRPRSGSQALKVILISSKPTVPGRNGFDAIVEHPVHAEKLLAALDRAFYGNASRSGQKASRGRILVVEDDVFSQDLLKILLTKNGYEVSLASDGTEAVEICKRVSFDLIFMDLQMPGMDGFTAATQIREMNKGGCRIPIVALTASNISTKAYKQFGEEFAHILTKPFDIATILQTIEECTREKSLAEGAPSGNGAGEIVNIQQALPHFGLDPEQYREIFSEFQESLPGRLADMEQALQNGDLENLSRRAHNLKGASANVGAMQLSAACAQLEDLNPDAAPDTFRAALDGIRSSINALRNTAQDMIEAYFSSTQLQ